MQGEDAGYAGSPYIESIMRILHKIQLALFGYGKLVSGELSQVFYSLL
ncbi:hypothetical protein J25TS5_01980 [Paenibacillus faecis]|nr:hypothetical protein J25TS5_01980 [Paenibacillus faecis]